MKLYPLVVKLEDKNCSLIGGGNQVHKKVLDLMEYSPKIFIFAETVSDSLQDLINNNKKIIWQKNIQYKILLKSHLVFISDEPLIKKWTNLAYHFFKRDPFCYQILQKIRQIGLFFRSTS